MASLVLSLSAFPHEGAEGNREKTKEEKIFLGINAERAAKDREPLKESKELGLAAKHQAANIVKWGTYAHEIKQADLPTVDDRVKRYQYGFDKMGKQIQGIVYAENLGVLS